jgi:hypothetical protein
VISLCSTLLTFMSLAAWAQIEKRIRDAMCGHAPETVGDEYETPALDDSIEALNTLPRYEV